MSNRKSLKPKVCGSHEINRFHGRTKSFDFVGVPTKSGQSCDVVATSSDVGGTFPFFIVLEGIDGSGKGTQVGRLSSEIKKGNLLQRCAFDRPFSKRSVTKERLVLSTAEPTNGKIGQLIREFLKDEKLISKEQRALLFASDRLDNLNKNIIPTLKKGGIAISERYVYSTLAYQSCEDIEFEWLCKINQFAIPPDLSILLDIDPAVSISRLKSGKGFRKWDEKEFFEKQLDRLYDIRSKYLDIFKGNIKADYDFFDTNFVIVDASKSVEEVHENIKKHVYSLIKGGYPPKSKKRVELEKFPEEKKVTRKLTDYYQHL